MSKIKHPTSFLACLFGVVVLIVSINASATSQPPTITLSNNPLTLVQPAQPQVLFAITNSESMDGDLSGAIMTGSGAVSGFSGPSSPKCYQIPTGFTPPLSGYGSGTDGCNSGYAPYTVSVNGQLVDNSPSRLNIAKQAVEAVVQQYVNTFSMGLMDYSTKNPTYYSTWVYYMSPTDGFTFSNSNATTLPSGAKKWVINPCYGASSTSDCQSIAQTLGITSNTITSDQYMSVSASSDQPNINDVFYTGGYPDIFLEYDGTYSPNGNYLSSPFPPNYSLTDYNNNNVLLYYLKTSPYSGPIGAGPTNAGYVPYSHQVLDAARGFGFDVSAKYNTGDLLIPVQPAGINGKPATSAEISTYEAGFTKYLNPETSKSSSSEIKASAVQSPIAGILTGAYNYFTQTNPPSSNGCPAKRYVVLMTDGLPTEDLDGLSWPPLGTIASDKYGETATFSINGQDYKTTASGFSQAVINAINNNQTIHLVSTNDQALEDSIQELQDLAQKNISTYIIGMGAGVDPSKNPAAAATLMAMAYAAGTNYYYPGTSAQAVVQDLETIFGLIQAANLSNASVAVNTGSIQTNTDVYQAQFSNDPGWEGTVIAYPVSTTNNVVTVNTSNPIWNAATWLNQNLPSDWNTFPIATWNPERNTGVPFLWNNLDSNQQTELLAPWSGSSTITGSDIINYLSGDTSTVNGTFGQKISEMYDIINSSPIYVGSPYFTSGLSTPLGVSTSTQAAFTNAINAWTLFYNNESTRTPMIYVGTNGGKLLGINATNGNSIFAFVPNGIYHDLSDLTLPTYNTNHKFYVDGTPSIADLPFTTNQGNAYTWQTVLSGGLNAGGQGIYALQVTNLFSSLQGSTNPSQTVANNVLWNITSSTQGFGQLGYTYSQPQLSIMDINDSNGTPIPTPVAIFGNGYDSASGYPYLYIVNAQTGTLIHTFDLCSPKTGIEPSACSAKYANGLSTPTTLSTNQNDIVDRAYAGDLQGNLWRFDLSSPNPNNWTAQVLFKATGPSGNPQPITVQPAISLAPNSIGGSDSFMIYFGTGQLLSTTDLTNTNTQSFYGILDNGTDSTSTNWLTSANLQAQTIQTTTYTGTSTTNSTITETVRTINTTPVNYSNVDGWYMDLPVDGERVITNPTVFAQEVVFTTNVPATSSCGGGLESFLMAVNYTTGGAFTSPMLDLNNDGVINNSDQVNGQNPVGLELGGVYASSPVVSPTPSKQSAKLISESNGSVQSINEKAGLKNILINWTELR